MTEFLRAQLEVYFIENPMDAEKIAGQVLVRPCPPGPGPCARTARTPAR